MTDTGTLSENGKGAREDEWLRCEADEVADVLVAAMALGGVGHLFFASGAGAA